MSRKKTEWKDRWALVTGASSGIGEALARALASRGCHLVLTARRKDRLEASAVELRRLFGVEVEVVPMDLGAPEAPLALHRQLTQRGVGVDILINNAGFGLHGAFLDLPWERQQEMIALDVTALTHLTHLFAADMVRRGWGRILQVASIGAFQPSPYYAVYAAAKGFVLSFGEALSYELKPKGVHVAVLSPGVTFTEFFEVAGQAPNAILKQVGMSSQRVAEEGLALLKGECVGRVPGVANRLTVLSQRLMPRRWVTAIAGKMMEKKSHD